MRLGRHIAVIGAGVVGLAVALRLRREGYRITIIEPDEPGSHTSAGNAGLIMTAQTTPMSEPGIWLKVPGMLTDPTGPLVVRWNRLPGLLPWLTRFLGNSRRNRFEANAAALAPMVTQALDAWRALVSPSDAARLIRQDGLLYVYKTRKHFLTARKEAAFRERFGIPSDVITPEELQQMEPALGGGLAGGVLYPESAHCVDPQALSASLSGAFRTSGGEVRRTHARALEPSAGGVKLIMDGGEMSVDAVVVAAGVWSPPLVRPFGVKPVLAAERGYHLMLSTPGISLSRPVMVGDHKFVVTPMAEGIRLAGTAEFASANDPADWRRADLLLPLAQSILPGLNGEDTATRWMGARPSTPDALPLVGPAPRSQRIICAFGHSHLGLTLAAVTAGQVADMISGRNLEIPADALRPDRF